MVLRATLTKAEADMFIMLKTDESGQTARKKIQNAVRAIRAAGGQEKKLFHKCLFKWMATKLAE